MRGTLLTTGRDDCPTLIEKEPVKPATVTETTRVQTCADPQQRAGTRGLHLHMPCVCINSKTKPNTGSPDLEKASGIDNQGLLKAWMLLPTEKKNNCKEKQKAIKQTETRL
jgi:hypothetical protein